MSAVPATGCSADAPGRQHTTTSPREPSNCVRAAPYLAFVRAAAAPSHSECRAGPPHAVPAVPLGAATPRLMTLRTLTPSSHSTISVATCLSYERQRKPRLVGPGNGPYSVVGRRHRGFGRLSAVDGLPMNLSMSTVLRLTLRTAMTGTRPAFFDVRQPGRTSLISTDQEVGVRIPSGAQLEPPYLVGSSASFSSHWLGIDAASPQKSAKTSAQACQRQDSFQSHEVDQEHYRGVSIEVSSRSSGNSEFRAPH
jgi:hypothetical protein